MKNIKLGILVSGGGTSAAALAKNISTSRLIGYEIAVVICSKPKGKAGVYEKEELVGIDILHAKESEKTLAILKQYEVDMVLGLGYALLVKPDILNYYYEKTINIHPVDLKYGGKTFFGLKPHLAVLAAGDAFSYPTVHLMNEKYDDGRVLYIAAHEVPKDKQGKPTKENAEFLQKQGMPVEYEAVYMTLTLIYDGVIQIGLDVTQFNKKYVFNS